MRDRHDLIAVWGIVARNCEMSSDRTSRPRSGLDSKARENFWKRVTFGSRYKNGSATTYKRCDAKRHAVRFTRILFEFALPVGQSAYF